MVRGLNNMKRILVAWLGSFAVMFALAGIFNTLIIRHFVVENIQSTFLRDPPNMLLIAVGYLLLAFLMAYIYPRVLRTQTFSFLTAVGFGMVAGISWLLPYSLVLHGAYNFPALALIIDTGWALIEQGLGGLVIGFTYSRLRVEQHPSAA